MYPQSEMLHDFISLIPSKHGETKALPANSSSGTDQAGFLKWAGEVWYRMCSESLGEEELNAKVVEFLHIQFSQLGPLFIYFLIFSVNGLAQVRCCLALG